MNDERFNELLRELAADYNAPPPTPRDAMWAVIDDARRGRGLPAPRVASRWWLRPAAGIAAVLVLGLAVGWLATSRSDPPAAAAVAGSGRPPQGEMATALPHGGETGGDRRAPIERAPAAPSGGAGLAGSAAAPSPAAQPARAPVLAAASSGPARRPEVTAAGGAPPRDAPARRRGEGPTGRAVDTPPGELDALVTTQTLTQGEALITAFRAADASLAADPRIGVWAREILVPTRLLLDSPVAGDAAMRGLLEDLELVLLQIAHLSGSPADSAERAWIAETLARRDILSRLRAAVPAGLVAAGP
ncbi:MAG TPA: hypothetical protein VF192_15040 [Longimicrobiales bacterium]